MRFRKRVKIFPGYYLNFSSSGVSSTIGVRGASINFSRRGTYLNTGIPGTGLFNRQKIGGFSSSSDQRIGSEPSRLPIHQIIQPQPEDIKSADVQQLTSTNFAEFKQSLLEANEDRRELEEEIKVTSRKIKKAKIIYVLSCLFIAGLLVKSFKNKIHEQRDYLSDLETQLSNTVIQIDTEFDTSIQIKFSRMIDCFKELLNSQIIWDITASMEQDRRITRSAANNVIQRIPVKFNLGNIDNLKSSSPAFHFENKNGGDLFIYPAFVIMKSKDGRFGIIDIKEFDLDFSPQRFIEEESIPVDTSVVDRTWAKVNKNGQPDRRFSNNYEIPIVLYGKMELKSKSGLNEAYSFSSYEKSLAFAKAFEEYQNQFLQTA